MFYASLVAAAVNTDDAYLLAYGKWMSCIGLFWWDSFDIKCFHSFLDEMRRRREFYATHRTEESGELDTLWYVRLVLYKACINRYSTSIVGLVSELSNLNNWGHKAHSIVTLICKSLG